MLKMQNQFLLGTARDLTAGVAGAATATETVVSDMAQAIAAAPIDTFEKLTITVGGAILSTLFVRLVNFLFGFLRKK